MRITLAHNHYSEKHLYAVVEEMKMVGVPTIKVVEIDADCYQAIEGCHRLRACEILGLTPEIIVLDPNTSIEDAEIDFDGCGTTVGEIGDNYNDSIAF